MIRLKAKQAEKEAEEKKAAEEAAAFNAGDNAGVSVPKPKTKILGVGRGKRSGISKEKRRTPGEIRIQKDIAELDGGKAATVTFPEVNDLTVFNVKIAVDTGLWKGASFAFSFKIPPIYHPNIDLDGNVCLNILREDWKPVLDINSVIYGLIYLFYEPNPDDPLNKACQSDSQFK
uniref:UBC core domain-containing protein n=1 Tax=Hyaloperonospora arabidopsidis (strain Emoy2) TaxID=559515 RepID=M4C090_HYAAE